MQIKINVLYLQKQNTHIMKAKRYFTLTVATALIVAGIMLHTSTGLALLITGMIILFINTLN